MKRPHLKLKLLVLFAAAMMLFMLVKFADAHAILKDSSPAPNSTVAGPDVPLKLQFNVRVDSARSKLQLVSPENAIVDLVAEKQKSPDTLNAKMTGLKPGAYKIRWQVLAPDGHITRGEIPFQVGS
ncbi:MAG TPA: copper resistance CopC family protein [Candidatus Acidoferrum sp.]|nr:copper resistance CopC family protein [Candidatus Acidoferrum sp.]